MRSIAAILLLSTALLAQQTDPARKASPPTDPSASASSGTSTTLPGPPPTPAADLASAQGQVLNAIDGTPLRKANISLVGLNNTPNTTGRGNYGATTDPTGHYAITGIEPGTYRLVANHTGFLTTEYNARRPGAPGTHLAFARGESKTAVDFKLTPHGVITGKVTDADEDPLEFAQIQLLHVVYTQGTKRLVQAGAAATNDLGEFRLTGIAPGRYYLCATYRERGQITPVANRPGAGALQEDYVPVFYPGVTDVSAASALDLAPGQQQQGLNLRLTKVHTVSISGHVIDSTAPPAAAAEPVAGRGGPGANVAQPVFNSRAIVRLVPRNPLDPAGLTQAAGVMPDGTFRLQSVAPGSYYLLAMVNRMGMAGGQTTRQALEVGSSDVEDVHVTIVPGATVTGHVHYDGDPPTPLPSLDVRLAPRESGAGIAMPPPAKVDADGNFRFDNVNLEQYDVVMNPPPTVYLKSLRSSNTDILVSGLDLSGGAAQLDVLLGINPPVVSGSVVNPATEQPAPAVTVVLIPRDQERRNSSRFYSVTNTDQFGNFSFSGVMAGEYDVYAWEDVDTGQWYDPDWMKTYEGKGESVTAQEGTPANVKLTMIPAK